MPLTNEEFARLDAARVNSMHHRVPKDKRILQLAFEHIEDTHKQLRQAVALAEALHSQRAKSLCWRIPAFFARTWHKVKSVAK